MKLKQRLCKHGLFLFALLFYQLLFAQARTVSGKVTDETGVPLGAGGIFGAGNPLSFINPNDIESFTVLVTEIISLKLNNKYA